jgi:DNA-binding SARP family transcriptional activator
VEYALLGPLEVRSDGRTIAVRRGKQRALLAVLALNAGRVVPTERLIDELWGEEPPATAATALQVYVSRLRKSLGEGAIETREPGYLVEGDVDVRRFAELVSEARQNEPRRAAELLKEALGLWRGSALCDCELPLEAARLEEQRVAAIEQRIEADLASGRSSELVGELESLVTAHPLREPFRAQLMLALYRAGRQAEALGAYRAARTALLDELGIEPSPRLQQLEQAILRQDDSLAAAAERTLTATALFLDLGVQGEVEAVAGRALALATDELGRTAQRVERGLADAVLAVFTDADAAVEAALRTCDRLSAELGEAVQPRAGLATAEVIVADRVEGVAAVLAARRVRQALPGEVVAGERTAAAARTHVFARREDSYVATASGTKQAV